MKLDGQLVRSIRLLRSGRFATVMYPFLSLAGDGTLYASWITQQHGRYCYRAIHVMRSPDGGTRWQRLDGHPLEPPIVCDDSGPTQRISGDEELNKHSWLFGCVPQGDKLHVVYSTFPAPRRTGFWPAERIHYVRLDARSGAEELRRSADRLRGRRVALNKWNGFLATRGDDPSAPLYVTAADDERIAGVYTKDGGCHWEDVARDATRFAHCYSIGGCRQVTPEGWVLGSFTSVPADQGIFTRCQVYFFRLRPGQNA